MEGSRRRGARRGSAGPRRRPGELENDVLAVLWKAARPMSVGEVVENLGGALAYATVATILTRLHTKDLVVRTTLGRAYWYEPAVTQCEYVSDQVRRFLKRGDRSAVLQGFLAGLSRDDEQALRDMLQDDHEPQDDHDPQEVGAAP